MAMANGNEGERPLTREALTRREFAAVSAGAGAAMLTGATPAAAQEKTMKTFTILHTNDIHSNLIGVGPASEYTPATLNDDRNDRWH